MSATAHLVEQLAVRGEQLDVQRHLAGGVRRATQARIEGADAGLDAVQNALRDLRPLDVVPGDLRDGAVHRQVVLAGGDDQVDLLNQAVVVHLVVVEQRAARRLAAADALQLIDAGVGAQVLGVQVGVVQQLLDALDGRQDLDQPGVVVDRTTELTAPPPSWRNSASSRSASGVPMRCRG